MLTSTLAIVLRTIKSGDSTLVVHALTERFGRMEFVANAGRGRGRPQRQLFQSLTQVEIGFDHRPQSSLQRVRSIRLAAPYGSIPFEQGKMAVAMFLAEFLEHATMGEREGGSLYGYVAKSLAWYDACPAPAPNFHLVFIIGVLRFLGHCPDTGRGFHGPYFDFLTGECSAVRPAHSHYIEGEELRLMPLLLDAGYNSMHRLRMSRRQRNRATDLLLDFCAIHIPLFPQLRSLAVVRELF